MLTWIKGKLRRKPPAYRCYWVAVHFPRAEDAARFINDHVLPERHDGRLLRGGDALPVCFRD